MILEIYLLCSLYVVISTVPINPIIPSQTYANYQQNDYSIPSLPPTNDYYPFLQQNTAQNSPPLDFKQILLNRILSRPSLQAILDPIAAGYGLNEMPNSNLMPNVVNNYIILPMDCPNDNKTDPNLDTSINKVVNAQADPENCNKINSRTKSKRKPRKEQDKAKLDRDEVSNKENVKLSTTKQKSNKNTEIKSNTNEKNNKKDTRKRRQRQNEVTELNDCIIDMNNNKTQLNTTTQARKHKKKINTDTNTNVVQDLNVNTEPIIIAPIAASNNDTKELNKTPVIENKVPQTVKSEIENDFMETFPTIPEDMAKHFMSGMNQFNDPQLMRFFGNYEQFFQSLGTVTQDANKRSRKKNKSKKNKRNRRRNRKNQTKNVSNVTNKNKTPVTNKDVDVTPNKTVNLESAPNLMRFKVRLNPLTVTPDKITTNAGTQGNAPAIINLNSKPINKASKSLELQPAVENTADVVNDERFDEMDAREDDDPKEFNAHSVYYGIIDDYYPLFNDNAAYENKKIIVKSLDGDRLFYIGDDDEIIDDDDSNRNRIQGRDTSNESVEDITERSIKDTKQLRDPQILESPGFVTRKVERSEIHPNFFDDKIDLNDRLYNSDIDKYSSYSNAKSLSGLQLKGKLNNDVETVFARSKVVKYGPIDNSEEEVQDDWDSFISDDTTYVLAKSLDPGEFW